MYAMWAWSPQEARLIRQLTSSSVGGSLGINVLELFCCAVATLTIAHLVPEGVVVVIHTDNECALAWVNGTTAQSMYANHLLRLMAMTQLMYGFTVRSSIYRR